MEESDKNLHGNSFRESDIFLTMGYLYKEGILIRTIKPSATNKNIIE